MNERALLFVYGSLKRGQPNHERLGAAVFVAEVRTAPSFALHFIAGYPALAPGSRSIRGELFRVSAELLAELDEFEGDGYVRTEIALSGSTLALAYLAAEPDSGALLDNDQWPM